MRSLHGVGSILRSKGRTKLLIAATAWPGARLGSRFQSESSTTPNERLSRLMTLASPILWRRSSCEVGELGYFIYSFPGDFVRNYQLFASLERNMAPPGCSRGAHYALPTT